MNSPRPRNFTDSLSALRRHLPAVILPVLSLAVASAAALRLMPGSYRSSAIVILEPRKNGLQMPLDADQLAAHLREQVTSRARIEKLIEALNLDHEAGGQSTDLAGLVAEIRNHIIVEPASESGGDSNALAISYSARDPERARSITANLVEQLLAIGIPAAPAEASTEVDLHRKRMLELSSKLREFEERGPAALALKESQIAAPVSSTRVAPLSGEAWRSQMNLESLNDQLYKLGQQIADLNSRIAAQRQIVEEQKKGSALNNNPTYALLITKRTELQGQRDNLVNRQELTDKHPRVLAIIDQIAAINNQVEELRKQQAGTLSQSPEARELLALEAERRRLQLELEVTGREVKRRSATSPAPPAVSPQSSAPAPAQRSADSNRIGQEYHRLKQEYLDATVKLQETESGAAAGGAKIERLRLLQPASLPRDSERPNALLIVMTASVVGLVLGACFALGLDGRRRKTIQNAADVEYYTRLPLLAAIPKKTTEEETRLLKRRSRVLLAAAVAVAFAATLALTKLLVLTEVFALVSSR